MILFLSANVSVCRFFFSSRRRHTRYIGDWSSDVCSSDLVSAGLDYAMIGPEHAWLHDQNRSTYVAASDAEALRAARLLSKTEGIIPALESAQIGRAAGRGRVESAGAGGSLKQKDIQSVVD